MQESFPNGLVLGSHGGDAGNSFSMSSGSGDGEAKSQVEESLLRWRLSKFFIIVFLVSLYGSGEVTGQLVLAQRGRVLLDRVED